MRYLQIARPEKGDPFFNTARNGGISTCIDVQNPAEGLDTLPNCVSAAWGCFNKMLCHDLKNPSAKYIMYPPDAGRKWLLRAQQQGLTISTTPAVGAVAVWGKKVNVDKGHVAFVYRVDTDGTIYTAESEYGGRTWVNRYYPAPYAYGAAYDFLGFILPPAQEHTVLREGSNGQEVRQLQLLLISKGYMRTGEADGDYGKITKGAVLCWQYDHELEVDGVCGRQTWGSLGE